MSPTRRGECRPLHIWPSLCLLLLLLCLDGLGHVRAAGKGGSLSKGTLLHSDRHLPFQPHQEVLGVGTDIMWWLRAHFLELNFCSSNPGMFFTLPICKVG